MRRLLVALALTLTVGVETAAAHSDSGGCDSNGSLYGATVHCIKSGSETNAYIAAHSEHTYSIRPACEIGGLALCADPGRCHAGNHDGWLYNVYEDDSTEPLDWQACLTEQEAQRLGSLTPDMVRHAFERLAWPASPLVVQPPKGRTLVNFDTNFYTTNTASTTRIVTLIGQRVTIEATPTQYTWHVGSGSSEDDFSTTDPGAPYPDLRVTYRYTRVGDVHPRVDTTYAGRYRVGDGGWQAIPTTLTVPGEAVDLAVVSATPHLVGY
jgi:hypothetical protein